MSGQMFFRKQIGRSLRARDCAERKVRAPYSGVAGNTRPSKGEDNPERGRFSGNRRTRATETSLPTPDPEGGWVKGRVKRGNLYAEQGSIGGDVPVRRVNSLG